MFLTVHLLSPLLSSIRPVFAAPAPGLVLRQDPDPSSDINIVTDTLIVGAETTTTEIAVVTVQPTSTPPEESTDDPQDTDATLTSTMDDSTGVALFSVLIGPSSTASDFPSPTADSILTVEATITDFNTITAVATVAATSTITVIQPPTTVTITSPPSATTDVVTVFATPASGSYWATPSQFTDLSDFTIVNFADGQQYLDVVDGIPADASQDTEAAQASATPGLGMSMTWDNSSTVLQILYPAGSINPGNADAPVGGSDFYAQPLDLSNANSVTLTYSVFFPANFDWVEGGKLPGFYGGAQGCSGGNSADNCFSTRMMWRPGGAGELYLYAPKDKQTAALCEVPPLTVCDSAWGLSIGRGSFYFAAGAWTNIRQTVKLNTPGAQDGGFQLEVNGQLIMDRNDVFYRDVPQQPSATPSPTTSDSSQDPDSETLAPSETASPSGLLPPLLGPLGQDQPLFGGILDVIPSASNVTILSPSNASFAIAPPLYYAQQPVLLPLPSGLPDGQDTDAAASALINDAPPVTVDIISTVTQILTVSVATVTATAVATTVLSTNFQATPTDDVMLLAGAQATNAPQPIGFSGLFFSTFFGGNTPDYATPTDQYTWFKDFSMAINS